MCFTQHVLNAACSVAVPCSFISLFAYSVSPLQCYARTLSADQFNSISFCDGNGFSHMAVNFREQRLNRKLYDQRTANTLHHSFPNVFVRPPLLASKNRHGSSHPCSLKYRCPEERHPKLKIYLSDLF